MRRVAALSLLACLVGCADPRPTLVLPDAPLQLEAWIPDRPGSSTLTHKKTVTVPRESPDYSRFARWVDEKRVGWQYIGKPGEFLYIDKGPPGKVEVRCGTLHFQFLDYQVVLYTKEGKFLNGLTHEEYAYLEALLGI